MKTTKFAVHQDYGLTAILAGACLFLLVFALIEWVFISYRSTPEEIVALNSGNLSADVKVGEFSLDPQDIFSETIERPLFFADRKPREDDPDNVESPDIAVVAKKLNATLMGVYTTDEGLTALVLNSKGRYYRVREGDDVDGWEVSELYEDRVVFAAGKANEELKLRKPKPKRSLSRPSKKSRIKKRPKK